MLSYTYLGRLGRGGFSELDLVELSDGRRVVLRRLLGKSIFQPREHYRFRRGTRIRSVLSPHRNIVASLEYGYNFLRPYEIIEYVQGDNLKGMFNARSQALLENREYILEACAIAVAHVHQKGFMHLDVKPENFMCQIRERPVVKLTDFDLARPMDMQGRSVQMGTPVYMAPEQLRTKRSSQASDVFSFGIMAYLFFTGKMPFIGSTPRSSIRKQKSDVYAAPMAKDSCPELSDKWNRVIAKSLEKRPERRYKDMTEVLNDLWS